MVLGFMVGLYISVLIVCLLGEVFFFLAKKKLFSRSLKITFLEIINVSDCLLFMNNKFRDLVVFYLEVK